MKNLLILATAIGLAAAPVTAKNDGNNGNGNGNKHRVERAVPGQGNGNAARVANPSTGACPPGLAKKNPPCVPPGQARQVQSGYGVGDRIDRDYVLVDRYDFDLPPLRDGEAYVRVGDSFYIMSRDERLVLDILDLALN